MSNTNPYLAPRSLNEVVVPEVRGQNASLIWMAAPVTLITASVSYYVMVNVYRYTDLASQVVHSLLATSVLTVSAVPVYALARYVVQRNRPYESTPRSLILAGVPLAIVMSGVYFYGAFMLDETVAWCAGVVSGLVASFAICAIERGITGAVDPAAAPKTVAERDTGASVFWFSIGCLLFGFVFGAMMQERVLMSILAGGLLSAVMLCLVGTVCYGLASYFIPRTRRATVAGRVAAAFAFTALLCVGSVVIDLTDVDPGLPRLLMLLPIAPACVVVDRFLSRVDR